MIATLNPRITKLHAAQRRLWPELRPSVALGFVLYGGTAVSLHLGHRRSMDFDFFHERHLDAAAIRESFAFMRDAQTLQQSRDQLVVLASGVTVAFFGGLRFGRVGDPLLTADGVLEVASLEDLLAHKLRVILQRAEKKDYEDIVAMLKAGVALDRGLAAARLLRGKAFQPAESLKALAWFMDGDLAELPQSTKAALTKAAAAVSELPEVALRSQSLAIALG